MNDSVAFTAFKFDAVNIFCTESNIIEEIWLSKDYSTAPFFHPYDSVVSDFTYLRNFLNENSGVREEWLRNPGTISDGSVEGFRWDTTSATYILRKFTYRKKRKGKQQNGSVTIKIY